MPKILHACGSWGAKGPGSLLHCLTARWQPSSNAFFRLLDTTSFRVVKHVLSSLCAAVALSASLFSQPALIIRSSDVEDNDIFYLLIIISPRRNELMVSHSTFYLSLRNRRHSCACYLTTFVFVASVTQFKIYLLYIMYLGIFDESLCLCVIGSCVDFASVFCFLI